MVFECSGASLTPTSVARRRHYNDRLRQERRLRSFRRSPAQRLLQRLLARGDRIGFGDWQLFMVRRRLPDT